MSYTLGTAAKATGKSRTAIWRAIESGKISASKGVHGQYEIDPAELHRVYQPVTNDSTSDKGAEQLETGLNAAQLLKELEILKTERERERQQTQQNLDDLRRRLDAEGEERRKSADEIRRLTLLLTHQREPTEADDPRPAPKRSDERLGLLWSALTVLVWVAMLGAVAFGLAVWWPSLSQP